MMFRRIGHSELRMSAKALGERDIENGLDRWGGFGQVKQKGKGIPGGRDRRNKGKVVREHWACYRNWE